METITIDVKDNKMDIVLTIIKNLKDDVIEGYHLNRDSQESNDFMKLSNNAMERVWDNKEDSVYDKYLK
ncbi:MAG: hypothetical protein U9O64_11065 [Campylobacterota bacterium]|nr:hypothetical protein [Campylobacterota bacterium]